MERQARRDPERSGVRLVLGAFIAFVVVFVVSSTWQITQAALGWTPPPTAAGAPSGPCGEALRAMAEAVDRGAAAAGGASDEAAAVARYREVLGAPWEEAAIARAEAACAGPGRGADAFAAVLRLRAAQEGFVRRQVVEIAPLRRDVSAYVAR